MNEIEAVNEMRLALNVKSSGGDLIKCAKSLSERGISWQCIYGLLQKLREELSDDKDEVKENAILDAMDEVWDEM